MIGIRFWGTSLRYYEYLERYRKVLNVLPETLSKNPSCRTRVDLSVKNPEEKYYQLLLTPNTDPYYRDPPYGPLRNNVTFFFISALIWDFPNLGHLILGSL